MQLLSVLIICCQQDAHGIFAGSDVVPVGFTFRKGAVKIVDAALVSGAPIAFSELWVLREYEALLSFRCLDLQYVAFQPDISFLGPDIDHDRFIGDVGAGAV